MDSSIFDTWIDVTSTERSSHDREESVNGKQQIETDPSYHPKLETYFAHEQKLDVKEDSHSPLNTTQSLSTSSPASESKTITQTYQIDPLMPFLKTASEQSDYTKLGVFVSNHTNTCLDLVGFNYLAKKFRIFLIRCLDEHVHEQEASILSTKTEIQQLKLFNPEIDYVTHIF